jgi:pimeloyl-ACP methyl ester carboxylesterase
MDGLGIAKADVAGWSMGGNEITAMAGKHPERINRIVYLDGGKLTQWCRHLDGRGLRTSPSWPPVTARRLSLGHAMKLFTHPTFKCKRKLSNCHFPYFPFKALRKLQNCRQSAKFCCYFVASVDPFRVVVCRHVPTVAGSVLEKQTVRLQAPAFSMGTLIPQIEGVRAAPKWLVRCNQIRRRNWHCAESHR